MTDFPVWLQIYFWSIFVCFFFLAEHDKEDEIEHFFNMYFKSKWIQDIDVMIILISFIPVLNTLVVAMFIKENLKSEK